MVPKMERITDDSRASGEDILFWITELYKQALRNHDFTKWEVEFISSVRDRMNQGMPPTELQERSLRILYNKTFGSIGGKA